MPTRAVDQLLQNWCKAKQENLYVWKVKNLASSFQQIFLWRITPLLSAWMNLRCFPTPGPGDGRRIELHGAFKTLIPSFTPVSGCSVHGK